MLLLRTAACCLSLALSLAAHAEDVLRIGSKRFTESYILGEIVTQAAQPFAMVEHRRGLGNTAIVFEALRTGAIDAYPEYLGTIVQEILKRKDIMSLNDINHALAPIGLGAAIPFGFSNGYALAMRSDSAASRISDLAAHPELRFGLSHEFLGRMDGWPGLTAWRTKHLQRVRLMSSISIRRTPRSGNTACVC